MSLSYKRRNTENASRNILFFHQIDISQKGSPVIEAITVIDIVTLSRDSISVFVDVASCKPIFHKELV